MRLAAFTLTEMVVVIAIILIITVASLPAIMSGLEQRRFGEASRTIQAAFAGARDRAIVSGQVRGIRLIRDTLDPWEVSALIYVGAPEPYSVGTVRTTGLTVEPEVLYTATAPDPQWQYVDLGKDNTINTADDIARVDAPLAVGGGIRTMQAFIRFNRSGRLYHILAVDNSTLPAKLQLDPTGPTPPTLGAGTTYQLFGPAVPLPQVEPLALPDGVVIDVRFADIGTVYGAAHPLATNTQVNVPRSRWIPNQVPPALLVPNPPATWPTMDILFGPTGQVTGLGATNPLIHLWVGERADKGPDPTTAAGADATPNTGDDLGPTRSHFLITLNTRTGNVEVTHEIGAAGTLLTNYAEIYRPAEQNLGVSQLDVP